MQRRSQACSVSGWQQVKRVGSFVWRGNGDNAQCCTRLWERVCGGLRTGMAWSSFVCWLVILIRAGSSEVGARSPGADVGIAFVCMS